MLRYMRTLTLISSRGRMANVAMVLDHARTSGLGHSLPINDSKLKLAAVVEALTNGAPARGACPANVRMKHGVMG